jgi:hypothetical protein
MNQRVLCCLGALAVMLAGSAVAFGQALSPVAKPAPAAKVKTWTPPRTPDGQPDLQGTWTNASNTPLERPKELGAKEFYTEQEFAEANAKKGFLGDRGGPQEVHYNFGQYGMDATQSKFAQNLRTSMVIGPEGRIPAMTPEAVKRAADRVAKNKGHEFDGPENRGLTERCILYGNTEGPPMLPAMYNNNMQIVQEPGYVAIFNEMFHDVRVVPVDGRAHIPQHIRQWRGDSIGHWEGNTLVVDTTNFTNQTPFHGSSENLHVVERFTRTSPETVLYEFTLDDPSTWVKPWTGQYVMGPAIGQIYEFACNEGNYGLYNNLKAARVLEQQAAEKNTK